MTCKKRIFPFCLLAIALWLAPAVNAQSASARQRLSFNSDWRFQKDDPPGTDGRLSYEKIKDQVSATGVELTTSRPASSSRESLGSDVAYTKKGFDQKVWLVKPSRVYASHGGTYLTTLEVSPSAANVNVKVSINNNSAAAASVTVGPQIFELVNGQKPGKPISSTVPITTTIAAG